VVKTLQWRPAGSGYEVRVSLSDPTQGQDEQASVTCSLTLPEYTIFEQLVKSSMAPMLGFDVAWGPQ
jgi:hypothetical protein